MKLLETHSLTFSIPTESQYDEFGNWVEGSLTSLPALGSLQSIDRGLKFKLQQNGNRTEDVKVFYTKTNVPSMLEKDNLSRPHTVIEGRKFYVHDREPNVGFGLYADHYKLILVSESAINGGGW